MKRYLKFKNEGKNSDFNKIIDYTILKPNYTIENIKKFCDDAINKDFYCVCVLPEYISSVKSFLDDTDIKICSVLSFPKGDDKIKNQIKDVQNYIVNGVDEIEMVLNYKLLHSMTNIEDDEYKETYEELLNDVKEITGICHKNGVLMKIIIEIEELNYDEIKIACEICDEASADYIMTSTGFSKNTMIFSEKVEKLKFMRKIIPYHIKLKIAGGIRNMEQIEILLPIVDRIGTSTLNFF
jgi:deoxyribose-phosphate aldolase